jgi:hypothetical protein
MTDTKKIYSQRLFKKRCLMKRTIRQVLDPMTMMIPVMGLTFYSGYRAMNQLTSPHLAMTSSSL